MAQTPTHHRVFAFTLAMLFLATSVAAGGFVIYQVREDNKLKQQQKALEELQNQNNENLLKTTNDNTTKEETKLEGTKLANFTPVTTVDKLQIIDTKVGTGETVAAGASVTAHYTGAVAATGVIFQSSHDRGQPVPFNLAQVIKGWTDGLPGMKVGGIRRLVIPADQAYGTSPPAGSGIPVNAPLVFDIELVSTP